MKDKTIKSPVIQSRYTFSNWCLALWRPQANVDLVKSEAGLVNMESQMEPRARWTLCIHLSKPTRQGYCAGSNFWRGLKFITDYCEPHKNWRCEKPPISVKVIAARRLKKSMGVLPRHSLWFVTKSCETKPQTHLEWKGFSFLSPDDKTHCWKSSILPSNFCVILKVWICHSSQSVRRYPPFESHNTLLK